MKIWSVGVLLVAGLVLAGPALSDPIYGGLDDIEGATDDLGACQTGGSSNPDSELCWAETIVGEGTLTYDGVKEEPVDYEVDGTIIFFGLESGPGYYIVKNAGVWILLANNESFDYGAFDTAASELAGLDYNLCLVSTDEDSCDFQISHVTEFNGSVPEPGTLALLGLGLVGIGVARRRKDAI